MSGSGEGAGGGGGGVALDGAVDGVVAELSTGPKRMFLSCVEDETDLYAAVTAARVAELPQNEVSKHSAADAPGDSWVIKARSSGVPLLEVTCATEAVTRLACILGRDPMAPPKEAGEPEHGISLTNTTSTPLVLTGGLVDDLTGEEGAMTVIPPGTSYTMPFEKDKVSRAVFRLRTIVSDDPKEGALVFQLRTFGDEVTAILGTPEEAEDGQVKMVEAAQAAGMSGGGPPGK